jgi:hypothetical protein
MHTAAVMDRYSASTRAITRQNYPEVGQLCVCTVTLDQLGNVQSATPLGDNRTATDDDSSTSARLKGGAASANRR